jgi:hypothetical protein
VRLLKGIRGFTALLLMAALSACGGGGSNQQASTSTSLNSIVFTASSPDAPTATPPFKTFTATVSPGTIYLTVLHNAASIYNVSFPPLSGTTDTITVTPMSPASLGAGVFNGTITVTGYSCADPTCSQPVSGNTQTVNVSYQIPPIVRFVAPYVVTAGVAGTVIIRGQGFQQFSVTGVMFGAFGPYPATVLSDTEIEASYPSSLVAGTSYPVTIQAPTSPGTIISEASLTAVSPPGYTSASISYPSGTPQVGKLLYDAARKALLVADATSGKVLRYDFSGGTWISSQAFLGLSDIGFSGDGNQLLAVSSNAVNPLNPTTLALGSAVIAPTPTTAGTVLKNIAMGNDGNAVVTTGLSPSTSTSLYIYNACNSYSITNSLCTPGFPNPQPANIPALDNSTAVASEDGSLISILQGDSTQTSPPYVYQYAAASDTFSAVNVLLNQNPTVAPAAPAISVYTPAGSTTANTYIVLSGTDVNNNPVIDVYDASYNLLGTLPYTNTTLAVAVDANAKRAYTFDSATSQVRSFALDQPTVNGVFPDAAAAVTLIANPGAGTKMTLSPDGGTLFLAGSSAVVVQTPP